VTRPSFRVQNLVSLGRLKALMLGAFGKFRFSLCLCMDFESRPRRRGLLLESRILFHYVG
jgi:hypothetical protein